MYADIEIVLRTSITVLRQDFVTEPVTEEYVAWLVLAGSSPAFLYFELLSILVGKSFLYFPVQVRNQHESCHLGFVAEIGCFRLPALLDEGLDIELRI